MVPGSVSRQSVAAPPPTSVAPQKLYKKGDRVKITLAMGVLKGKVASDTGGSTVSVKLEDGRKVPYARSALEKRSFFG